ncbi:thiamine phosphate synthase [Helicobacter mehlei]|uniref:Thiamine-phosphate synthase n=1 Tax=Helicobacter mehlei TaxID=2316080 RepID=A0A553UU95_9HELI|nr:thiamine phosphate synthase [Helicobacter mehlei]TSA83789.1 thiamine phosphate synthase [Helicobacter mehlei]
MGIELKGLYALSDEILTPYDKLPYMLSLAIQGGVKIFQFRDKSHSDLELLSLAQELAKICQKHAVGFVINDRLDLALKCHAWGLHLGSEDVPLSQARRLFKGYLGVSCYGNLDQALQAQQAGASYVAFGACFPSLSKPQAPCISLETLQRAKAHLNIPICAIGGISPQNTTQLKNADMIAVISSLWSGDIVQNAKRLLDAWRA